MARLRVPEEIGAFEHARCSFNRRGIQRDDAMACLVLAPSHVQQPLDEIHVAPPNVLHLHRTHRRVGGNDCGAVDVLPFRIRGSSVEQTLPLLGRQCATDGTMALRQVLYVIREPSPSAAELEDARSTPTSMLIVRFAMPAS